MSIKCSKRLSLANFAFSLSWCHLSLILFFFIQMYVHICIFYYYNQGFYFFSQMVVALFSSLFRTTLKYNSITNNNKKTFLYYHVKHFYSLVLQGNSVPHFSQSLSLFFNLWITLIIICEHNDATHKSCTYIIHHIAVLYM